MMQLYTELYRDADLQPAGSTLRWRFLCSVAFICAIAFVFMVARPVSAQSQFDTFRIEPYRFLDEDPGSKSTAQLRLANVAEPMKIVIDTDPGVDDTAAIAYLLSQTEVPVEVLGIVAVAGNTDVKNGARNILSLLEQTGHTDIPVIIGEKKPLKEKLSKTGKLVHGADGLWGFQSPTADEHGLSKKAKNFYCDTAKDHPGARILVLGPATNIAKAIKHCKKDMDEYSEIVMLGGAKFGGNATPNAEVNWWQDPEAVQQVLAYGARRNVFTGEWEGQPLIRVVPMDTFNQMTLSLADVGQLAADGISAGKFIADPLFAYICALNFPACLAPSPSLTTEASVSDLAAVAVLLKPSLSISETSLINVVAEAEKSEKRLARGLSVMAIGDPFLDANSFNERILMITDDKELSKLADDVTKGKISAADFNAALFDILASEPDNALVVTDIFETQIRDDFISVMTGMSLAATEISPDESSDHVIYLPLVEK